jgi:signal transduction histidine kinase
VNANWTLDNQAGVLDLQASGVEANDAILVTPQDQEEKVNILVVDDRPDKLMAVETIIAELGQNVVKAQSGQEALRHLLQTDFAVILLDVNMPGLDGFETAALIRQRKKSEHTPIIFLTAVSDTETHVSRGYSLGAVDYILAPVLPDVLRTKVSVFVELHRKNQQIHSLNQQLQKRVAQLTETNQALEAFTYSIAHDLRAPLRAMLGFSRALLEDYGAAMDASGQDFANRIVGSAKRMDDLIQDLLSYSRLSREQIKLGRVKLEAALDEVLKQCEPQVREKEAEIRVESLHSEVWAHRGVLVQMLVNLVSNSLKFVATGVKPRVRIWSEVGGPWVRLSIQDNGIGIASEHHQRIFRVFERLHGPEEYPGTGIGLANVSKAAERMGGRVGVESQLHQGSRFWVELPKAPVHQHGYNSAD